MQLTTNEILSLNTLLNSIDKQAYNIELTTLENKIKLYIKDYTKRQNTKINYAKRLTEIKTLYKKGYSCKQLAEKFNVSYGRIQQLIKK